MAQIWSESRYQRPQHRSKGPKWWTSGQNWGLLARFGPFCLNLSHYARIWAILQNLGQNRPQRRRSPEDEARGGTDGHMDGQTHIYMDGWTDSPCVLQDFVPFGAAAQKTFSGFKFAPSALSSWMDGRAASLLPPLRFTIMKSRVRGIADHILPLSDWFGLKSSFEVRRQAWGLKGRFEVLKADLKPGGLESRYEVWKADLRTRSLLLPCKKRLTRCWSIPIIWSAHPGNYNIQTDTYPWNYITFTQKNKRIWQGTFRSKEDAVDVPFQHILQ